MKLKIAWIGKTKTKAIDALTDDYLGRISRYVPAEGVVLRSQEEILPKFGASAKSGKSTLVLMDSRGREFRQKPLRDSCRTTWIAIRCHWSLPSVERTDSTRLSKPRPST